MILRFTSWKDFPVFRLGIIFLLCAFLVTSSGVWEVAQAQTVINLPAPGTMVSISVPFNPLQLKGVQVHAQNPLQFDFLVDKGQSHLTGQGLKDKVNLLTKYFLTCLTVPENDLWVNLSPYEKDRIAPRDFGNTQMGKDLLEQDYLLKQITATLSYPQRDLGRRFWLKMYEKAYKLYGTTDIPVNTFNKVWIVPKSANVYVHGSSAFITHSELDVMLDTDYLALRQNLDNTALGLNRVKNQDFGQFSQIYNQTVREMILPILRKEVNEGKNFAVVRQVYDSMILATWYKRHLKDSFLGKIYIGKNKVAGVDLDDKTVKERIFQQYLESFKRHVYNFIKEDYDPFTQQTIPRKYVSGGLNFVKFGTQGDKVYKEENVPQGLVFNNNLAMATINLSTIRSDGSTFSFPDPAMIAPRMRAMATSLRKYFNNLMMGVMLAISLGITSPGLAHGAVQETKDKNVIQALSGPVGQAVQAGTGIGESAEDDPAKILEKIRNKRKLRKEEDSSTVEQQTQVTDDQTKQSSEDQPILQDSGDTDPQSILKHIREERAKREKAADDSTESQIPKRRSNSSSPADPWLWGKIGGIASAVLFAVAGFKKRYLFSVLYSKAKTKPAGVPPVRPTSSSPSKVKVPVNGYHSVDVSLPPTGQAPGEASILAEDLAKLYDLANGKILPPPPIPAEEDEQTSAEQSLRWMDVAALLGGIALSVSLGGGVPLILARILAAPFIIRALYVAQRTIHEKIHLIAASLPFIYPKKLGAIWSLKNVADNLSLGEWVKSFIPILTSRRPMVNLPFANVGNSRWKNKFIALSGLAGTIGLVGLAWFSLGMTPLFGLIALSALGVLKGSLESGDLVGTPETDEGKFGCGIIVLVKRVDSKGVRKKDVKSLLTWFQGNVEKLTVRGGQQSGIVTNLADKRLIVKQTKKLRNWSFWQEWDKGPVFFRSLTKDLFTSFNKALPRRLVPVYNYTKTRVIKFLDHVRFATGGIMTPQAAQPFQSPYERREVWVYDAEQGRFRKVIRYFQITNAFNGDHDGSKIGIPYRAHLKERQLTVPHMRSFYSAVVHKYYPNKITKAYLKRTVRDTKDKFGNIKIHTNHAAVLQALHKKGYINFWGYVNPQFKGIDKELGKEFISWFPGYADYVFDDISSALFGMPPGDGPILPLEQHLDLTQGSWFASLRYAHVMANHHNLEEARDDILFEKQARAVGDVFSEVYDQVEPYLARRGYASNDPDKVLSLRDQYVKDLKTAQSLGLVDQYRMIEVFKEMLLKRMKAAAQEKTVAGEVFRRWEEKWNTQGEDAEKMRRRIIDVAVEKFFTADNVAATKEFSESSDGTYGLFMDSSLDDSVTFYQDNQDVVIGLNRKEGYYGAASDPRVLKSTGPKGEKFDEVIHLKDGEVANVSFSPSGKIIFKSWIKTGGEWRESTKEELEERFYPTAEYYYENGVKKLNPYYAPPAYEYKNTRKVVQEDLENTTKILAYEQALLDDPKSFNAQSTDYLSQRIRDVIDKKGNARLVLVGFDNSYILSEQFKTIAEGLFDMSKLRIDVIESNKFDKSPSKYNIQPDDIVLAVSKSGATFSTKLALRLMKTLVHPENIFCMGARIDSVSNTVIGQGLRPGKDKFTKRVFVTGEFYPSETPVVSEVLLAFQLQQLALNLARKLQPMNARQRSNIVRISAPRLKQVAQAITAESFRVAQEMSGFDKDGKEYKNADQGIKRLGTYLGKAAKEQFFKAWFMKVFVGGVLIYPSWLIASWLVGSVLGFGIIGTIVATIFNVFWLSNMVPFLFSKFYRKWIGRPKNAAHANFQLYIAASERIHKTQRNFFSRIMTNRFSLISPTVTLGGDPEVDFTSMYASDVKPGDPILRFHLTHKENDGKMGVAQVGYPVVEVFGPNIAGNAQIIDVGIDVNHLEGATKDEMDLMDNSVGFLGMMLASKKIGVTMADEASYGGRLFNLASTFSSAGVYTTQINPISEEAREMLDSDRENGNVSHVDRLQVLPFKTVDRGDNKSSLRYSLAHYSSETYLPPARHTSSMHMREDVKTVNPSNNKTALRYTMAIYPPQPTFGQGVRRPDPSTNKTRLRYTLASFPPPVSLGDRSMRSLTSVHGPGGIIMNSRLMKLNITGDAQNSIGNEANAMSSAVIKGIVPQVSGIVTVTPEMLKNMLGAGYLN